MQEVVRSRNLLSGFVTTLKRLFESVKGTLFCLLLYVLAKNGSLSLRRQQTELHLKFEK